MITFLDENDVEYGALATIKATNAVNGERSLTGTIVSGDYVLSNIERGWRLRFDDEYYVVTYVKPIDEGRDVQVEFDAVHQFFWDFDKSSVYDQLSDGSHTFRAYLDFIFKNSGYSYTVDSALNVYAFEKQSFGFKKRLTLFNDIITSTGVEFQVNGKVVRILEKVGTDLSTVVRKNFNMNELTIEKNIGDFVTYQKGFGAYFDEEDHSKGRLEVEYTSPLASVYGKLEAEPLVDERYSQSSSLLAVLKENVDNSYSISVSLDMEDLTRAGYKYKQPIAGDYIMAINETLGFKEKIRIVSFTSEYDVQGILVKHGVTCNDIGSVKKLSASYTHTQHQAANAEANANTAYEYANKALVSADGKNTNYYGDTFPVDNPKGTLKKGDLLFLTVGDTVKQYYWNGADWVINPVLDDVEAFKEQIADELKDVPNREEFENKISEELANSKAEIETQIETAKTQAESNAKEYADRINDETAKVAELANAAADEIKEELVNVKNNLTSTSLVANNAQAAVDAAKQDLANVNTKVDNAKAELAQTKQQLTNVANDLSKAKTDLQNAVSAVDTKATNLKSDLTQAKQDLTSQAQQLQEQANAQSELTNRVSSVEETANGTKTTVNELTKTVAQNGKDITSVTARTKVVEDDLTSTKTTLSQVQTTANSASQKTATLETGLSGLTAKFNSLSVGNKNYLPASRVVNRGCTNFSYSNTTKSWTMTVPANSTGFGYGITFNTGGLNILLNGGETLFFGLMVKANKACSFNYDVNNALSGTTSNDNDDTSKRAHSPSSKSIPANVWTRVWFSYIAKANVPITENNSNFGIVNNTEPVTIEIKEVMVAKSNVPVDYQAPDADLEQKIAEYKQNADQNYASLQTTVQNLDGTVQHNKTVADQTAQGFTTRIESLETYKDGETTRANQYFESAKTETARQLSVERTAIAKDYVAKSTYTSDVTGIRNDLSATTSTANTTKTNLANYQASNDRAVANLQSNLQEANGNISSLKTKVEAVPGQITSAVSSVEGKIPTNVSTRNLILKSNDLANPHKQSGDSKTTVTSTDDYFVIKSTGYTADGWGGMSWNLSISEVKAGEQFSILMPVYIDSSVPLDNGWVFTLKNHPSNTSAYSYGIPTNKKDEWFNVAITFKIAEDVTFTDYPFYIYLAKNGLVRIKPPMLVRGSLVPSDYQPAFEDAASDVTKLNTTLTQTADGLKQLSTQVTSQGNTITSHTNSINSLNTGLQAKVSQSEFNKLSGRVTSAENNITAKANELSSKITTVEGKIPTSSGGRNLAQGTSKDWSKPFTRFSGVKNTRFDIHKVTTDGLVVGDTFKTRIVLKYTDIRPASGKTAEIWLQGAGNVTEWNSGAYPSGGGGRRSISGSGQIVFELTDKINADHLKNSYWNLSFRTDWIASGSLQWKLAKAERGMFFTDWSPAPEDTIEEISSLSSELKQTKDGITLLATKTELNTAKSDLQSGINTATNKANSAQNKANSNAQTISTHTNQISALNTGLSAKVSQSDFNTLSGRVTNAENNITAKANELSSKITSVEGKIPSGEMNLVEYGRPADGYSPYAGAEYATHGFYYNGAYKMYIMKNTTTSENFLWMNRFKVERNTDYTLFFKGFNNSALTSMDVWFLKRVGGSKNDFDSAQILVGGRKLSTSKAEDVSVTFNTGNYDEGYLRFDNNGTTTAGTQSALYFGDVSVKKGKSNSGWSPSLAELASSKDLKTAQSEFKQTTDAIKASVTSLDKSTVKSSSLTINADGIVMKAGKSTTDVANAIGSYFAVNQNAINLFSDKINVKGNMIVNGAITSDKIASKSINTAHLNGKIITADVIATNAITANAIKAGAVTTDKMSANSINGDRITAGTLDAAKIKAGSITASQIASGTITSNQIKAGGISSANIAAGAITGDKIAAGAIDANKIAANAITANMIRGGQLNSTNGATSFDLNAGTLTFNNNYGYIQRVASDKVFEITTWLHSADASSQEYLTSAFKIRKSDYSRLAGAEFTLYNATSDRPTARANINADTLMLFDSKNTPLVSIFSKGAFGNVNFQGWGDIPVADLYSCGLTVKDIAIGGHTKSLLKIVEELCKKAGILWV